MFNLRLQVIATAIIILIDTIYLRSKQDLYAPILALSKRVHILPAVAAWAIIVLGVQWFSMGSFVQGAMLGFVMYGLYNMTNMATIDTWTVELAIKDTLWGMILVGLMSTIMPYFNTMQVSPNSGDSVTK